MNWYIARLTLQVPFGTPWQADTIFGHLCWAMLRLHGEPALRDFLEPFRQGEPTLLLSSGFPEGLLPKPLVPLQLPSDVPQSEAFQRRRTFRKLEYLTLADFQRVLNGTLSKPDPVDELLKSVKSRATTKNQVSRLTGTTGQEGNLFGFIEYWMPKVVIYLKLASGIDGLVKELFDYLAETGYGKRKSVGYGAIRELKWEAFPGFATPPNANGFVTLSPFVPAASDPTDGSWRTRVKYGKLGEERAVSGNPFKRPVLMLTEGSVFYDPSPREWYGRLVTGVSRDYPDAVHYGYALAVPMRLARMEMSP